MTDAETADLLPAEADSVPYAVGCFLGAILLFAAMDTLIKFLTADYPVPQLMFVRSLVAFLLVGGYTLWRGGGIAAMRTRRPWGHVWRAFAGLISMGCFFYAFRELPLADVYVLSFAGPLFITALSAPLLGEPVGWRRWAAVVIGFGGVVVMAQPSAGAPLVPVLVGLCAALFYALAALAVRGLSRTETSASIVLYLLLTTTVVSGALAVPVWTAPTGFALGLMALVGAIGAGAQVLLTQAFRRAPPAVVAPFEYTGMVWASLFGWLVFGDLPTAPVIAGAMVIIGSGLYILHRETLVARRRLGS
ncbi:S-adenosylmethionine uptake transporter [Azospirillum sp. TSH7]|jgi:drug/metabolite transporter (DMT)-like permease|uniref:DMT family transporter n=1 Tax=unclassified Azospirillum TaxID=2630922 RepID=UPI000D6207AB|nr:MULTISPECIES: DMT family transporter [unclassified Azospirillum]PWC66094.1 S-adenosylmethionine uptake transporter [Azospirillum sp. TSH7]PWC72425.1 S-adenosylmethionine uptake transporter [Azospirillum sp. TSH20]